MITTTSTTYQLSPRVTLTPGDQFLVSGGPYYRSSDGRRIPLAARGRLTFIAVHRTGARVLVEARDGSGTVMLHLAGRRKSPVPGVVARQYKIRRRVKG